MERLATSKEAIIGMMRVYKNRVLTSVIAILCISSVLFVVLVPNFVHLNSRVQQAYAKNRNSINNVSTTASYLHEQNFTGRSRPTNFTDSEEALEEDVYQRAERVRSACTVLGLKPGGVETVTDVIRKRLAVPIQFLIEKKYQALFCQIFKAGSTNVKRLFIVANKDENNASDLDFMKLAAHNVWAEERTLYQYLTPKMNNFEETIKRLLADYSKILFVRHPFERLVSYYRMMFQFSSFEGVGVSGVSWSLFNRVQRLYGRPEVKPNDTKNFTLLFPFRDFAQFVIDHSKCTKNGTWVIDGYVDTHWMPVTEQCFPCQVGYDIIGKLETFDHDLDQVAKHVGIRKKILYPNQWKRKTHGHVKDAFRTLSPLQIIELKRIYDLDFKLFNYEYNT